MDHPTRRLHAAETRTGHPSERPCYECEGPMVRATLRDRTGTLLSADQAQLVRLGTIGLFGASSDTAAFVCMDCGAVRLYATEPRNLES